MIVSASQPYFAPYPGFFAKALRSDVLVLMDAVQFPRGGTWLTRNRFKNDQGSLWLSIPVWKKGLGLQRMDRVRICHEGRWMRKHLAGLESAYADAPFFASHKPFLEKVFSQTFERLVDMNVEILRYLLEELDIRAEVRLQSELAPREKEPELSVAISRRLGASAFLAQSGARKYLDAERFLREGLALRFFNPRTPVYPQLWGPFIPNLSAFDLLFNCGPAARDVIRKGM
ncbi:MAG: WbqC family protein [Deltaproteobacteria bacterium]|nr:WbqC family protein [Deltaproteobacteria bacterium]